MKNRIPYTSFSGDSQQLCTQGNAVEFIQPWYTPISTTPSNTGIAVGGIGNTFTLTPLGNTPSFAFIPGIFIDNNADEYNFNDFHLSVAKEWSIDQLAITDLDKVAYWLRFYPALFDGKTLEVSDQEQVLEAMKHAVSKGNFYAQNEQNFTQWNIEFTSKTLLALAQERHSVKAQLLVMVDFFNGLVINRSAEFKSLSATASRDDVMSVAAKDIEFSALYPMAEFAYSCFDEIKVTRKVCSPIVKGNKKLCSLPLHWNEFELTNDSSETKMITVVQSLKNLIGSTYCKQRPGVQDSACTLTQNPIKQAHSRYLLEQDERHFVGVVQRSDSGFGGDIDGEVLFGAEVATSRIQSGQVVISSKPSVYCHNEEQVILDALRSGRVNNTFDKGIYTGREALSSVVAIEVEIEPRSSVSLRFVQVMDHSKIHLQDWVSEKAYTQFYPQDHKAIAILEDSFSLLDDIESQIVENQKDYLKQARENIGDERSALQFATMAMNSLSFLSEATVWDVRDKFLVKECVDYPFFNSLDVYFYGSFSLLYLLPELDGCVLREFAHAILAHDDTKRRFWEYEDKPYAELVDGKYEGVRGIRGAVIHDLGSPFDITPDAYTWHNVKEWKDLAPKFALMVYRHYQLVGDFDVVKACWPAVKESIEYLKSLIEEGDVMPLTRGTDDTFDNLSSHGVSIYCGSLWVAGLYASAKLAYLMNEIELSQEYRITGELSLKTLERGLWDENKGYFHFFVTPIQVKHLTGEGYEPLANLGLLLSGDKVHDKEVLNRYLDGDRSIMATSSHPSRYVAKRHLLELAPKAFTDEYKQILELDSDNSFGDAMLADTYLKLLGIQGLFADNKVGRTLDFIYQTNFKENSPKLGVANMTLSDGMPHDQFQAQDVWVGVQFSMATALRLAGKGKQAVALMNSVYDALYHESKIPFAAPEGFNCSVPVNVELLMEQFMLSTEQATKWHHMLTQTACLLPDGRVNPDMVSDVTEFSCLLAGTVEAYQTSALHVWLKHTGLKYTAGRYFRPGMIFSYLPEALI